MKKLQSILCVAMAAGVLAVSIPAASAGQTHSTKDSIIAATDTQATSSSESYTTTDLALPAVTANVQGTDATSLSVSLIDTQEDTSSDTTQPSEVQSTAATKTTETADSNTVTSWQTTEPQRDMDYEGPLLWHPTWLPDGWKLSDILCYTYIAYPEWCYSPDTTWSYTNGDSNLYFRCYSGGEVSIDLKYHDAADDYTGAKVWGRTADYYEDANFGGYGWLYWQGSDGTLFELSGKNLGQSTMERIANSVLWDDDKAVTYHMSWKPDGLICTIRDEIGDTRKETWADPDQKYAVYWNYSSDYEFIPLDGTPETVTVNGVEAQYWAPANPDGPMKSVKVGYATNNADGSLIETFELCSGIPVKSGEEAELPTEDQMGFLLWTDPATGVHHRLTGYTDKETLIRIAESVVQD